MNYIDGFLAAVPLANKDAYITHAKIGAAIFKEYGALRVVSVGAMMYPMVSSLRFLWR